MPITVDEVVGKYIMMRNEIAQIEAAAESQVKDIKVGQQKLEAWLRLKSEETGVDSFKTAHGTAYFKENDYASIADWSTTLPWIVQHEAWDMLQKRITTTAVRNYLSETKQLPPGVNFVTRLELNVRKPTKS